MSSFLCFICHNTVNSDTNEETREKYRDVVGMNVKKSFIYFFCIFHNNLPSPMVDLSTPKMNRDDHYQHKILSLIRAVIYT